MWTNGCKPSWEPWNATRTLCINTSSVIVTGVIGAAVVQVAIDHGWCDTWRGMIRCVHATSRNTLYLWSLSFGTRAQHSIEEYPHCGQFQLFESLSNTWSRRKLGSQRHMKDLQTCLNKSPPESMQNDHCLAKTMPPQTKRQYTFHQFLLPICLALLAGCSKGSLKQTATNQIWLQRRQFKNRLQQA